MGGASSTTTSSFLTRSGEPADRQRWTGCDLFSPLWVRRVLLLASLIGAVSLVGSWLNTGPDAAAPSRAAQLQRMPAGTQAAPGGWLARVQQGIAEREYQATRNQAGLQAPNRAHALRTYFEASGIRVHDRTAPGSPDLLFLSLSAVGRPDRMQVVQPGEVESRGARVEIQRPGLVEWYENSPKGLEQGFTVTKRLGGNGPLVLVLAVEGARASARGDGATLQAPTGRRLAYGKLAAVDAEGHTLVARLEVPEASLLQLVVEDEGAVYPVVVDPLLRAMPDARLESDQESATLGTSVAGAGDVNGDGYDDVIVGAPEYDGGDAREGAAFVFLGSPAGIADGNPSTAAAKLESDQEDATLGTSVAGTGDVNGDGYDDVIVGAPDYDAGETDEGAAFLFLGSASGIADGDPTTAAARLDSDQGDAYLGYFVAGAGDVNGDSYDDLIIGAPGYDAGETDEGAAFLFLGSASGIADGDPTTAAAQLESDQESAGLGGSVAGAGDVNGDGYDDVIIGAPWYDAGEANEGAAFMFLGSTSGIADGNPSTATAQLESNEYAGNLGDSVAGAGDVNGDGYDDVIVGATSYPTPYDPRAVAFLFLGNSSGITDGGPGSAAARIEGGWRSGSMTVARAGDVNGDGYHDVIVGAPSYPAPSLPGGGAFVFLGSAAGIASGDVKTAATHLVSDQRYASLGRSVAGAGDVNGDGYDDVIVGAPGYDAGEGREGVAFVFLGDRTGIVHGDPSSAAARFEAYQESAWLGRSVAGAGDVNGDGYDDVIVGARLYDAGEEDEGAAFVFLGSASGIADGDPTTAAAVLESNQVNAGLGRSVAGAGDVNGDGYDDVIVGAPGYDAGEEGEGAAFVFLGSASGIADGDPTNAAAHLESNQAYSYLGSSVAGAGDVDSDGYDDVITGTPHYDAGEYREGAAFVFLGSAGGIVDGDPSAAAARLESDQASAQLGTSVAGTGDVNGDGYDDVIVGAPYYDAGETNEGVAFVFLGSASGITDGNPATAAAQIESNQSNQDGWPVLLGSSVAGAGDVNGDGYDDVIVGAPYYSAGSPEEGAAFVFMGSAAGLTGGNPATASARLEANQSYAELGTSVAGAGDVNGDGYDDVIVGAESYDLFAGSGVALLFLGSAAGVADGNPMTAAGMLRPDHETGSVGCSVAGSGDVNGDGYDDVIVGAYGQLQGGAAYVFEGGAFWDAGGWHCNDNIDNDGDGYVDWNGGPLGDTADPGCADFLDTSECSGQFACDDGVDNDGDGRSDFGSDPGCVHRCTDVEDPPCQDGINNDPGEDSSIDFDGGVSAGLPPGQQTDPDPQCAYAWERQEKSCGLGAELALLLPGLLWLRQRRRRVRR